VIDFLSYESATVADFRNQFATVSKWIHDGESVTIPKRGRPFAKLSPAGENTAHDAKVNWPVRAGWRKRVFPGGPVHGDAQDIVNYDRGDT